MNIFIDSQIDENQIQIENDDNKERSGSLKRGLSNKSRMQSERLFLFITI